MLKGLRKATNRNADYCKKELETRRSQETFIGETTAELKAMKSKMNKAEERISDLEERIMEITQSTHQRANEKKKEYKKPMEKPEACQYT